MLSSEHAGLRPEFKALEAEIFYVLARVDDAHQVRDYLRMLRQASRLWCEVHHSSHGRKLCPY